jgi:hypothetical protein
LAKESFAQKCTVVLEELKAEAMIKIRQVRNNENNHWVQSEEERRYAQGTEEVDQDLGSERAQVEMEETNFFGGEWNDINVVSISPGISSSLCISSSFSMSKFCHADVYEGSIGSS